MTIRYMMFVGLLSLSPLMSAMNGVDKKITAAIKDSDVEVVSKACMAGSTIPLSTKKIYIKLAREATKLASTELDTFGFADIKHIVMGTLKVAAAGTLGYYSWGRTTKDMNYTVNGTVSSAKLSVILTGRVCSALKAQDFSDAGSTLKDAVTVNPHAFVSGALAAYLAGKSIQDFLSVFSKDERHEGLLRALAVEALVNNIPALELNS